MIDTLGYEEAKRQRIREVEIAKHKLIFASLFLAFLLLLFTFHTEGKANEETHRVTRVIDGDTVQIEGGQLVRYIGIDTPEIRTRDKKAGDWKYEPEPFAEEAKKFNETLVKAQKVRLEFDVQKTDRFGRVLAYVYVGKIFINDEMVRQGYAQLLTIPPNVRYVEKFKQALQEARKNKRGMWK